ncbi:hypothetical protein [Pedosphaera parvula]|uniref:Peptidase C51 domain-containing protein n=1 Tax=Pedosphaera parvula (strain Ellin514) TaxID=320771 RepID=B9XE47_PEDPL|nr:hypothetical protein [Pedosphaera parvula]EEF61938.1 hypothetical protein Cflav_PD4601 [Pedosphaera parvula Ellin514]
MRYLSLICWLTFSLSNLPGQAADAAALNTDIIRIARSFKDGGGYNTAWKGTGTAEEINFKGEKILACGDKTYCCGFTFTVVMRVAAERGLLKDKTSHEIRKFQKEWYGATATSAERQCQLAMKNLGIGKAISFEEAQLGDFVQLWRTKSGHSVLFVGWVEENGQKIGMHYRSSQPGTDGIGDATEYFTKAAPGRSPLDKNRTYFCRLNPTSK